MDFKQLRSFVAVADCGSFTQAAAKLYASQPTVSAHIRQLEDELHETLFLRTTKSLAITPRGRELYDYAVHVLDLQEQLMRAWAQDERTIRLGASTIPSSCIACVSRAAPGSRVFDFAKRQRRRFAAASRGPLCTRLHRREGRGTRRGFLVVFQRPHGAHHAQYPALSEASGG